MSETENKRVEITLEDFTKIKLLQNVCVKKGTQPSFELIFYDHTVNSLIACSHHLIRIEQVEWNLDYSGFIPNSLTELSKRYFENNFDFENCIKLEPETISRTFPNWKNVIPTKSENSKLDHIKFGVSVMSDLVLSFRPSVTIRFELTQERGAVLLFQNHIEKNGETFAGIIMPRVGIMDERHWDLFWEKKEEI